MQPWFILIIIRNFHYELKQLKGMKLNLGYFYYYYFS